MDRADRICPQCGTPLAPNQTFCTNCGRPYTDPDAVEPTVRATPSGSYASASGSQQQGRDSTPNAAPTPYYGSSPNSYPSPGLSIPPPPPNAGYNGSPSGSGIPGTYGSQQAGGY